MVSLTAQMPMHRRCLERFSSSISTNSWEFREVIDSSERDFLILLRSKHYQERHVKESRIGDTDPFDQDSRFFVLVGNEGGGEYISKAIRVVNRKKTRFGFLPSELSLMNLEMLKRFSESCGKNYNDRNSLVGSNLGIEGRKNLLGLLNDYKDSDKVYEVGGLFGSDPSVLSPLALILGIGKIGNKEEWDLVIQTQHPRHIKGYEVVGFPYRRIAGHDQTYFDTTELTYKPGYLDHCGRPAITLALEGEEFREVYGEHFESLVDSIFRVNGKH